MNATLPPKFQLYSEDWVKRGAEMWCQEPPIGRGVCGKGRGFKVKEKKGAGVPLRNTFQSARKNSDEF